MHHMCSAKPHATNPECRAKHTQHQLQLLGQSTFAAIHLCRHCLLAGDACVWLAGPLLAILYTADYFTWTVATCQHIQEWVGLTNNWYWHQIHSKTSLTRLLCMDCIFMDGQNAETGLQWLTDLISAPDTQTSLRKTLLLSWASRMRDRYSVPSSASIARTCTCSPLLISS